MAKGTKFRTDLARKLRDPKFAANYIMAAIEENDSELLAEAIGEVIRAQGKSPVKNSSAIPKKEYDFSKMKEVKNPYPSKKKAMGINLSTEVITYFKRQSEQTGIPYPKLIDLYLIDCVKNRRKLSLKWSA